MEFKITIGLVSDVIAFGEHMIKRVFPRENL